MGTSPGHGAPALSRAATPSHDASDTDSTFTRRTLVTPGRGGAGAGGGEGAPPSRASALSAGGGDDVPSATARGPNAALQYKLGHFSR